MSAVVVGLFQGITPLEQALGYHMERHNVLSTNVAHVDTPGFRPMELERNPGTNSQDFGRHLSAAMTRTNPQHLAGAQGTAESRGQLIQSPDAIAGMDGNYVSLDQEAAKIAENQLKYEVISALASAQFRTLSYAASDGRG
jgi:flagellar basal-body rod protein FlgB